MTTERKMTPEARAKLWAELDELVGIAPRPKPRPAKIVAREGRVVRDVEVQVPPNDPNYPYSRGGVVRINMAAAERQWEATQAEKELWRRRRKELDPFDYGHWGHAED